MSFRGALVRVGFKHERSVRLRSPERLASRHQIKCDYELTKGLGASTRPVVWERQARIMERVYASASKVLVWLGNDEES